MACFLCFVVVVVVVVVVVTLIRQALFVAEKMRACFYGSKGERDTILGYSWNLES
jgi:uncharacterized protein HemY